MTEGMSAIMKRELEAVQAVRDTGRCPDCGTGVCFEVDEDGDVQATCPGCGKVRGWSRGFFGDE